MKTTSSSLTSTIKKDKRTPIVLLVAGSLAAGFIGGLASTQVQSNATSVSNASDEVKQQIVSSESEVIAKVYKDVGESVVSIDVTTQGIARDFFGFGQEVERKAAGTGLIISDNGIIVTNKHVVPTTTSGVKVTLSDGTVLDAEVIARDPRNDIAFIRITDRQGKTLKAAPLGDVSNQQVGDKVIAIGNALGEFQNTVTSGIISGIGRDIAAGDSGGSEDLTNLIQTDAAINQGNSGGPLVNLSGEVIGINTAITSSYSGQSLGFAIPINDIKSQITSVLEKGKIERAYLGVRYQPITDRYAFVYNLPVKRGAYLPPSEDGASPIVAGSPADKAGLKEKDIIVKIDDQEINEKNDLVTILGTKKPGDSTKLTVIRDGKEMTISVTLETAPEE
jgi:serine protease Do